MATKAATTHRLLREMAIHESAVMARTKEARENAGLTQRQVADALEVHVNTVHRWENVAHVPMRDINRLAVSLGVTMEWLLYGDDAPVEGLSERLARVEGMLEEVLRRLPGEGSSRQDVQAG